MALENPDEWNRRTPQPPITKDAPTAVHINAGGHGPDEKIYSKRDMEAICAMAIAASKLTQEDIDKIQQTAKGAAGYRKPDNLIGTKDAPAPAQDGVEELRAKLAKFIADQKPTPAAIAKFVNEHMSELYDDGPQWNH